jgi:hypothetical protein
MSAYIKQSNVRTSQLYQIGDLNASKKFYTFLINKLDLSFSDDFPQQYKVAGVTIYRDFDVSVINYLIFLSGTSFVALFSRFQANNFYISKLYFYKREEEVDQTKKKGKKPKGKEELTLK